jgi:VanZ family protein
LNDETRNLQRNLYQKPRNDRKKTAAASAASFTPKRCQIIACVFFSLMLLLGAIPGEAQALSNAFGDKLLHLCAYSFLTFVLFGALSGPIASPVWRTLMTIGLLAGVDEAIQSFIAYRNASVADWLVDMLAAGVTLAVLVLLRQDRRRRSLRSNRRPVRVAERPN